MPYKSTISTVYFTDVYGQQAVKSHRLCLSNSTLKPDGSINFAAQNAHEFMHDRIEVYNSPHYYVASPVAKTVNGPRLPPGISYSSIEQIALARFNGKLRKGNASLGVTIGSWGQSAGMISTRLGQASRALTKVHSRLVKDRRRLRKIRKEKDPLANLVLENQFGWLPLFTDIHAAFRVLAGVNDFPAFIRGSHKVDCSHTKVTTMPANFREGSDSWETWAGEARVTVAARVAVSNPNVFLLNQLGLLNPTVVAWDLVPWSFVVNMFVNVNSMLNSLTEYAGLSIDNKSVTSSSNTTYSQVRKRFYGYLPNRRYTGLIGHGTVANTYRWRTTGSLPAVKLSVKIPELNKTQMLIAASLVLQKVSLINKLIAI